MSGRAVLLLLTLLLASLSPLSHAQQLDNETDFSWVLSEDSSGVIITGRTRVNSDMNIPPYIQGLPVTAIGTWAFLGNQLTSLIIPDSVVSIGAMAFAGNQLTSLTLGSGVNYIETLAFADNNLTSVTIPDGVRIIGYAAFRNNQLTRVVIPDSVISIGDEAFGDAVLVASDGGPLDLWIFAVPPVFSLPPFEDPARFWSVGVSGSVSFLEPLADSGAFVASGVIQGTVAPRRNVFIGIGLDIIRGSHRDYNDFSSWSVYPFAHAAFFLPAFGWYGGFYAGAGLGFMIASYSGRYGDNTDFFFAVDVLTVGVTFSPPSFGGIGFKASYTIRTDFSAFSDRFSLGVVYRFRSRGI